jgi:hypothetical protein
MILSKASSPARRVAIAAAGDCDRRPTARSCRRTAPRCTCLPNRAMRRNARPFIEQALHSRRRPRTARAALRAGRGGLGGWRPAPRHRAARRTGPRTPARPGLAQAGAVPPVQPRQFARHAAHGAGRAAPAGEVPYLHGMLAFGWEQCHLLAQAEAAARHAIHLCRKEPWAHHALAHVMLTQGRIREGQAFMAEVSDTWTGLNSFMVTHNWWHQALFALELDDHAERTAPVRHAGVGRGERNIRRTRSMPCRCWRGWSWPAWTWATAGRTWPTTWPRARHDHVLPFLDMQYLYGLARAGGPRPTR